jgi:HIRAN domain
MNEYEMDDRLFELTVEKAVPSSDREKAFYTKVAGASHPNVDGSSRAQIIKKCEVFECLNLVWEQDNKFDPNAVAVRRVNTGQQLGYLDARLAGEVVHALKRRGPCWTALFRHPTHHPETGKVVGAVLYMIRFSDTYLERKATEASQKSTE